ncbi:MAG: hypothetical protein JNG86_13300 [Verrucomicrobiaceae bacterium]|nr:hypothetical protein [Verrucomicrobiaceae bacterium]
MTMTFDIPADVQSSVDAIPDLAARVVLYLRHEARLEQVRQQRHSAAAREIAARAVKQAQQEQASGFEWDSSFDELQRQHQNFTARL